MFKLDAIDKVLAELGDHVDFATVAKKQADLGVQHFQYEVADGSTTYFGADGYLVERRTNGLGTKVALEEDPKEVAKVGQEYVDGKLSLAEAVKRLAAAGCQAWTANLMRKVIDFSGNEGKFMATIKF